MQTKNIFVNLISALLILNSTIAQTTIAPPQSESIAITGANIHLGNGTMIQNGAIVFDKGKILYVGTDISKSITATKQINATGKEIYPGIIISCTNLGLNEIEQVKATVDDAELGQMNANVRSLISYNTDSRVQATLRSNGVLYAEVAPQGAVISGQSSIMQLDAWNWEDAAVASDIAIHLNWPSQSNNRGWWGEPAPAEPNDRYNKEVDRLKSFFDEAYIYSKTNHANDKNLRYESTNGLWTGNKKLLIHVSRAKEIIDAVTFAKKYNITPVLVNAEDSWRVTDFLKQNQVPILINETHNLPMREDDDTDINFKTPKILHDAGILFGLKVNGFWQQRNILFQAGESVAYGLPKEAAVASITGNVAKIFGLNQIGTIEVGKDASFFISNGDALNMMTNEVTQAFIQGRDIDLDNHQKVLYRKYKEKYNQKN